MAERAGACGWEMPQARKFARCRKYAERVDGVREHREEEQAADNQGTCREPDAFRRNPPTGRAVSADPLGVIRDPQVYPDGVHAENRHRQQSGSVRSHAQPSITSASCPRRCTWPGCGRSAGDWRSDYRYSNRLVYNNFPWPQEPSEKQRAAVEEAAQAVLDVRRRVPETGRDARRSLRPAGHAGRIWSRPTGRSTAPWTAATAASRSPATGSGWNSSSPSTSGSPPR